MNACFSAAPDQFEGGLVRLAATWERIPGTEGLGHEELRQKHLGPKHLQAPGPKQPWDAPWAVGPSAAGNAGKRAAALAHGPVHGRSPEVGPTDRRCRPFGRQPREPTNRAAVNGPKCLDDNLFGLSASSNTLHGTRIMIMIAAAHTPLALECPQPERGCSVAETRLVPRGPAGETWSEWSGLPGPPVWTYGLLES